MSQSLRDAMAPYQNKFLAAVKPSGAEILDPLPWLCSSGRCPVIDEAGRPIYFDNSHIRADFVRRRITALDDFVIVRR